MKSENTLRLQVEDILCADEENYARIPAEDVQSLMRQLQIQQIALELENNELRDLHSRLREKRDQYRRLFENIPNCCIVLDASQTVRAANEPATSVLKRDQADLVGTNWREMVHPDDRPMWDSQLELPGTSDDAEELNIRIAVAGELISDRWWCCRTRNDSGQLESVLLVLPLEQVARTESALHQAATNETTVGTTTQEWFRLAAQTSRDVVIGVSVDGTILSWNSEAESLLEITADDAVGTSILRLAPFLGWAEARQLYTSIRRESSISNHRIQVQTEDGRLMDISLSSHPVPAAAGHASGSLVVIRDTTQLNRITGFGGPEETEDVHTSRLKSMGELIAILAHELSQPLTVITGCAATCEYWLESGELGDRSDVKDAVERINQQADRAGAIIRNLRRFVAKSANTGSAIDLNEEVRDVRSLMESQITGYGTDLQLNLEPTLPMVQADGLQIQQVLVNLLQNSLQAMRDVNPAERRVIITTRTLPESLMVSVCDNGHGISQDVADRLFEPHFSTRVGGLGMGLPICSRIIEAHKGELHFSQEEGAQTTFEFSLPRTDR